MSTIHEILKYALSKAKPDDVNAHKDIYSFIQHNFGDLSATSDTVPVYALTYAIRRMLRPEFLLGRIPELLDYLWHVDKYRQRAVEISSQIMIWQNFYKNDAASKGQVRLLNAKEEKMIAGFEDKKKVAGGREAFCECAIRCCRLHIYYLSTAQESHLLPVRLQTFFPGARHGDGEAEPRDQFHWDFSREEREKLDEAQRQSVLFLKEESEWEQSRETFWKENGWSLDSFYDDAYMEEFANEFDPPYEEEETIQWIDAYLKRVENMVQKLENTFNNSRTRHLSVS